MEDFFPTMNLKPNPVCDDRNCLKNQKLYQEKLASQPVEVKVVEEEAVVHEEEWGIELVDESADVQENKTVAKGIEMAYTLDAQTVNADTEEAVGAIDDVSLEDLMAAMKSLK